MNTLMRVLSSLLLAAGTGLSHAAINLVSSDQQAADHPLVRAVEYMAQQLAQRSKGEIQLTVKAGGSLGSEQEVIRALIDGRQAMARVNLGILADRSPAVTLASLPYLFRSPEHMWKVLEGDFGQRLDRELDQLGLVRLSYLDSAPRDFYCQKPIRTQADFKGRKIRVLQSQVLEDLITNLGASAVPLPFNRVAEAMRGGEIDCAEGNVVNFVAAEHYKVAPWLIQDEHLLIPEVLLISKKVWLTLNDAQKEALRQSAADARSFLAKQWAEQESSALAVARKAGVTIITRNQISMGGIEAQAMKTYNKYLKAGADLETVMRIMTTK